MAYRLNLVHCLFSFKVLLKYNLLFSMVAELSSFERGSMVPKPKIFTVCFFTEKVEL